MSRPDPDGPADLRAWQVGDELVNPVTGEYAHLVELPWQNPQGRARAELLEGESAEVGPGLAALAPLAHAMGYRGTYPQLSRSLVAGQR